MSPKVVDTNVWIVCGSLEPTGDACETACRDLVRGLDVTGTDTMVVDTDYRIFGEYRKHLSDQSWAKHVLDRIERQANYDSVAIEEAGDSSAWGGRPGTWYCELPKDPALSKLDPSDRKFAAVAVGHPGRPPIVYARDALDWEQVRAPLKSLGIALQWICPTPARVARHGSRKRRKP